MAPGSSVQWEHAAGDSHLSIFVKQEAETGCRHGYFFNCYDEAPSMTEPTYRRKGVMAGGWQLAALTLLVKSENVPPTPKSGPTSKTHKDSGKEMYTVSLKN